MGESQVTSVGGGLRLDVPNVSAVAKLFHFGLRSQGDSEKALSRGCESSATATVDEHRLSIVREANVFPEPPVVGVGRKVTPSGEAPG